jgi:hypothetical protein
MKRLFPLTAISMATALAADIPIREVILYKSGVGYFERAGALSPGESARLDFKATDMNDVLKSLTLQDRNGGKVTGLRYDSSEPLEQKLAEFPFKIASRWCCCSIPATFALWIWPLPALSDSWIRSCKRS